MSKVWGLVEAMAAIASGALDPKEHLKACAARADDCEPWLKAFVHRASLDALLETISDGPLTGIPVGAKDLMATGDMPTTNGSPIYVDHMPDADATIVAHIRALGGAIFGKTVTTEFAWREPGPTVNPWNKAHTPGGSSSGSAAAVAAGVLPLALGTQTVGSVIRPAAYCGIVGFKASFGAVPRAGVFPFSGSLDHVGLMTRSVDDAACAFNLLRNKTRTEDDSITLPAIALDPATGVAPLASPRFAVLRTPYDDRLTSEQTEAMARSFATLKAAGATLVEFTLPDAYWVGIDDLFCLMEAESSLIHRDHVANFPERTSAHLKEIVARGAARSAVDYLAASERQRHLRQDLAVQMAGFDAILCPPATGEAPEGLSYTGDPVFCALWTFLGAPAVTLPIARGAKDLPLGLQLVGPYRQDTTVVRAAKWVETALGR